MNILGEKIVLRAIEPGDALLLKDLINEPETEQMVLGWSFPVSMQEQINWINSLQKQDSLLRCIIQIKESNEAIGTAILSNIDYKNGTAGIHIKISGKGNQRGRGYGFDTINCLVNYAFKELRLNCIYAQIATYNKPSVSLFLKCGFEKEGILRKRIYKRGEFFDVIVFSIINPKKGGQK